ncbi:MAG TPA: hypothetical protein VEY96_08715, partial [Actinomycetes bacterium]|nr:hypothetical protein [Actinomycetes bacterium]
YAAAGVDSTGQNNVSVTGNATVFSAAALSASGTCYWIRESVATGTTYGSGIATTCSGTDANGAALPAWT